MSEWIDINERLPTKCRNLFLDNTGYIFCASWTGKLARLVNDGITHWMPLPERPSGVPAKSHRWKHQDEAVEQRLHDVEIQLNELWVIIESKNNPQRDAT